MKDISNRSDIERLVRAFYIKVHAEPRLAPIFEMPKSEFERHLERTFNFWENWLFQTGNYHGGMMWVHIQKHAEYPLTTELFERWLALWFLTADELFSGENTDFIKNKAFEIGQLMNKKLNG